MRFLSVLALFILPCLVFANDGFGALGAGGIIIGKTNDIAMAKEVLDISYDKIKVDYEFVNESDKDITETIVFPLPPYSDGEFSDGDARMIRDFTVTVDGKPIKFKKEVRAIAFVNNREMDITLKLKKLGLNTNEIIEAPFNEEKLLNNKKVAQFIENSKLYLGSWKNYVTYTWKQTFKAHQKLKVSHIYTPLGSGGSIDCYNSYGSPTEIDKTYCIDSKTANKLSSFAKDDRNWRSYPCLPGTGIRYILRTANTWKDGIRDFHLILRTKNPDETVSTCFSKSIQQTSPMTYEVKLKTFKPKEDLSVYFGNLR